MPPRTPWSRFLRPTSRALVVSMRSSGRSAVGRRSQPPPGHQPSRKVPRTAIAISRKMNLKRNRNMWSASCASTVASRVPMEPAPRRDEPGGPDSSSTKYTGTTLRSRSLRRRPPPSRSGTDHRPATRRAGCRQARRRWTSRRPRRPVGRDRGRARARTRRLGRTDAALPDQDAHQVRRLDLGQLDVRAFGKVRMHGQRRRDRVQPRFA